VTAKPRRSKRRTRRRWRWSRSCSSKYCAPNSWSGSRLVSIWEMATSTEWPTAITARPFPRRAALRRKWAARYVPFILLATLATSASVRRSHGVPRRVRPLRRRPPLSALPGHLPAQEARCSALGQRDRSVPILSDQHLRSALADAGDGPEQRDGLVLSGQARCQLGVHARDGRIQGVQMSELLARAGNTWWASSRPTTAWASASRLARSFPRGRLG
jgi:hypothetical protein